MKLGVDSPSRRPAGPRRHRPPHGTGKTQRVLVFAKGDKAEAASAAGADFVGEMDMVEKIQKKTGSTTTWSSPPRHDGRGGPSG